MLTRLTLPLGREELEGAYKYSAKNTISGRRASQTLQYIYKCKQKPKPTYNLAYGGWARGTIGSQNFGVLTKRDDDSLFLRS